MVADSANTAGVAEISLRGMGTDRPTGWTRRTTTTVRHVYPRRGGAVGTEISIGRLSRESPLDSYRLIRPGRPPALTLGGFLLAKEHRNADGLGMTQFSEDRGR